MNTTGASSIIGVLQAVTGLSKVAWPQPAHALPPKITGTLSKTDFDPTDPDDQASISSYQRLQSFVSQQQMLHATAQSARTKTSIHRKM